MGQTQHDIAVATARDFTDKLDTAWLVGAGGLIRFWRSLLNLRSTIGPGLNSVGAVAILCYLEGVHLPLLALQEGYNTVRNVFDCRVLSVYAKRHGMIGGID